jgi:hypothetical protein
MMEHIEETQEPIEVVTGDFFLRFANEDEAMAVLYEAVQVFARKQITDTEYLIQGTPDEDGDVENYVTTDPQEGDVVLDSWPMAYEAIDEENQETVYTPRYRNIDIVGTIYKPTGKVIKGEDGEYPEMAPIEGFHVNVRLEAGEDWEALIPYQVFPENPVRVWA